ncbi:hypothetical protein SSTG_04965 [Streptomyces sp. e14]|nr:hypothetical protein SSTG_04965 [Streptomyces sp. e14]
MRPDRFPKATAALPFTTGRGVLSVSSPSPPDGGSGGHAGTRVHRSAPPPGTH